MNKMEVADEIESKMEGAAVKEENSRLWEQLEEARSAESLLVLSMDQFLQEHGIKPEGEVGEGEPEELACAPPARVCHSSPPPELSLAASPPPEGNLRPSRPSIIVSTGKLRSPAPSAVKSCSDPDWEVPRPKARGGALYKESKRVTRERAKLERKRRVEEETEFAEEDLRLATVPGLEFDPRQRAFDMEELQPQPIIKKRAKKFVPATKKDAKYWEARAKNTEASRRSKEAKRLKENQICLRTTFLEQENVRLEEEVAETLARVERVRRENSRMRQRVTECRVKK